MWSSIRFDTIWALPADLVATSAAASPQAAPITRRRRARRAVRQAPRARPMAAQSASIHTATGATYTFRAFRKSLASAILTLSQSATGITVHGGTYAMWDPQFTCTGCSGGAAKYGLVRLEVRGHRR